MAGDAQRPQGLIGPAALHLPMDRMDICGVLRTQHGESDQWVADSDSANFGLALPAGSASGCRGSSGALSVDYASDVLAGAFMSGSLKTGRTELSAARRFGNRRI